MNSKDRFSARRVARPVLDLFDLRQHPPIAWIVLAVSLFITAIAWNIADRFVTQAAQDRFTFETEDIKNAIAKRMLDQELALKGGVGLFSASNSVDRQEWAHYVDALDLKTNFPGLQGFGYSVRLAPDQLAAHVASVRAEGFPTSRCAPTDRAMSIRRSCSWSRSTGAISGPSDLTCSPNR